MPAIRGSKSNRKTRRRARDVDQVHLDLRDKKHLAQHKEAKAAEDLPGLGQWYCVECAKWFENDKTLKQHQKGKPHKRRLRQLKEEPYTQKEAEAAIGLTTDKGRSEKMAVDEPDPKAALVTSDDTEVQDQDDSVEYNAFFSAY